MFFRKYSPLLGASISSSNIDENDKLKQSLNAGKTISIKAPKSERYTYYAGLAGKKLEKFKPETPEEKDTLSPIGFFRVGERQNEAQKKIQGKNAIIISSQVIESKTLAPPYMRFQSRRKGP